MEISRISVSQVAEYIREPVDNCVGILPSIMDAARAYIRAYTGLTDEQMDAHEDLTMAYLLLCQELYDHRSAGEDSADVNRTLDTILGMHTRNLV